MLIVWTLIIIGAIVVTRICLFVMNTTDIITILTGTAILFLTWSVIGVEIVKIVKKWRNI